MALLNIKQVKGATQGSVLFLGSNGVVSENNSKLYWDSTNYKLGIGTQSGTNNLYVYSSAGVSGFDLLRVQNSVSTFTVNDAGYASYTGNNGFRVIGSNGRIDVISNGGVEPGINLYYNNGSSLQGTLYGQNNSMFLGMPNGTLGFGFGTTYYSPSAMLNVRGITSGVAFKVQSYAGVDIFEAKNSGYVSIGTSSNNSIIFSVNDRLTADSNRKVINVVDSLGSELLSLSRNTFSMSTSNQRIYSLSGVLDIQYIMGQGAMTWYNTTYGSETLRLTLDASPIFSSTFQNAIRFDSFVGIGLTGVNLPTTKLHIYATQSGVFRLQDTTQAAGYVLTSDANGVGTWQPASGGGSYTFSNGITYSGGNVKLGGYLTEPTLITNGVNPFTMSSTGSTIYFERVNSVAGYTNTVKINSSAALIESTDGLGTASTLTTTLNTASLVSSNSFDSSGVTVQPSGNSITAYGGDGTYSTAEVLNIYSQFLSSNGVNSTIAYLGPSLMYIGDPNGTVFYIYTYDSAIGDGSSNNRMVIDDSIALKGLVYANDYTANFSTHSLVTKGYVTGLITNAATGSGTTNYVTKWISSSQIGTSSIIVDSNDNVGLGMVPGTLRMNVLSNTNGDYEGFRVYSNNQSQYIDTGFGGISSTYYLKLNSGSGQDIVLTTANNILLQGGNVGIGTASPPSAKLHVRGSGSDILLLSTNGGVSSLWFSESRTLNVDNDNDGLTIRTYGTSLINNHYQRLSGGENIQHTLEPTLYTEQLSSGIDYQIQLNSIGRFYIKSSTGNVSIGAGPNPTTKLHIYATQSGDGFRLVDTTEGNGKVLTSDSNGVGTWATLGSLGIGSTNKSVDTRTFTASIAQTITHNLNTSDVIVQNYDSTGVQIIADTVTILGTGSVSVEFSQNLTTVKTVIIG